MKFCIGYFERYMNLMKLALRSRSPSQRKSLYYEAQLNLAAWFDAVEEEAEKRMARRAR